MDMDKKDKYRSLWLRMSYSVVRDGYIEKMGVRAFAIFMIIRTYANKENIAFPSMLRIAHLSGCNIRTVQKEIAKLEQFGWLEKQKMRDFNGRDRKNKYEILENNLIRGTGQSSFTDYPVEKFADGS